jgi:uncharacterized protein involved in outer membrane biogenesis
MPRCLRPCLIGLATLLLIVATATLAFNLHLQSPAMQEELQQGAMETIGLPLTVRSVIYTPWDGIRLRGLVVPDMENAGINFLEASEFQVAFRLLPLLRREFVVSHLTLKEAVLTWRQNADGQWRVPRQPEEAVSRPAGTPSLPAPEKIPPVAEKPPAQKAPAFGVRVEGVNVRRSRILFENRDAWPLLDADGISVRAALGPASDARGEVTVPEAVLAGLIVARDLTSPFTLEKGVLSLPEIRGDVSGGQLSGNGTIATRNDGSPYDWNLQLDGFRLNDLRLPASFGGTRFEGLLSGQLELAGRNAPQRQIRGTGHLEVQDGKLVPPPHIQELGRALDIRELRSTKLEAARLDLRIEDDFIHVEPLWLRAENLAVELRGTITRAGKLDLAGRLLLAPKTAKRLAARTGREWPVAGDGTLPDYRVMKFKVTGTLEKPESDFTSRLLGGGMGGKIGEMFLNFLGAP